jgi:hypothetical protein
MRCNGWVGDVDDKVRRLSGGRASDLVQSGIVGTVDKRSRGTTKIQTRSNFSNSVKNYYNRGVGPNPTTSKTHRTPTPSRS